MKPPIPRDDVGAAAWAVRAIPKGWELGEWLGRIIPEGVWSDMEPTEIADQMVGAAVRAAREPVPG